MPFGMSDDEVGAYINIYKLKLGPEQEQTSSRSLARRSKQCPNSTICVLNEKPETSHSTSTYGHSSGHRSTSTTASSPNTGEQRSSKRNASRRPDGSAKELSIINTGTRGLISRLWTNKPNGTSLIQGPSMRASSPSKTAPTPENRHEPLERKRTREGRGGAGRGMGMGRTEKWSVENAFSLWP